MSYPWKSNLWASNAWASNMWHGPRGGGGGGGVGDDGGDEKVRQIGILLDRNRKKRNLILDEQAMILTALIEAEE